MNNKIAYFLVVAEELNISKAAARLFISQQCLSTHIKNLEKEYGTQLLNRKPKLSLTAGGEILVRTYQKMQILENSLKTEIEDIGENSKGHLNIGLHWARSQLVTFLSFYWKIFPNISFNIVDWHITSYEKGLLDGSLDFFIGVNPRTHPLLKIVPLLDEQIFIVISDNLLRQYFPDEYPQCKERFVHGVDLREFEQIPFFLVHETSRLYSIFSNFLYQNDIKLNVKLKNNDGLMRIELAAMGYGASICTQLRIKNIRNYDQNRSDISKLNAFPVKGFDYVNKICLVYHKDIYQPEYARVFIDTIIDIFSEEKFCIART